MQNANVNKLLINIVLALTLIFLVLSFYWLIDTLILAVTYLLSN